MAIAQGACPNCGANVEFSAGASISKVCPYCRHVILRTDRDLRNLGRAADLANTPARLAVGDRGTSRGVGFEVLGRVQLDYGRGPWDEFYVSFSNGTSGWITEAQGNLYVTCFEPTAIPLPPHAALRPDMAIELGRYGTFKVAECRAARVVSSEGELPHAPAPARLYADLHGPNGAFAAVDYGDGSHAPQVFVGSQIAPSELQVVPRGGERPGAQKVALESITCPNCGAALPAPADAAIERVACRYCNALSDLRSMQVIARQAAAYKAAAIPLGSTATLQGTKYTAIGYMARSASIEGERFAWHEYLLYGDNVGFRWLVEDEGHWLFTRGISAADVETHGRNVKWHNRSFHLRNEDAARVDFVMGEFYWKVEVGETVSASDFISGSDVISREASGDEVNWSYSTPVNWSQIARAFGITGGGFARPASSASEQLPEMPYSGASYSASSSGGGTNIAGVITAIITVVIIVIWCVGVLNDGGTGSGSYSSSGGSYGGGYHSYGGFGGK